MRRRAGAMLLSLAVGACAAPLEGAPAPSPDETTFGQKFFTIACQRVAYTSSLAAGAMDPDRPVDVSGSRYRLACRYGPRFLPPWAAESDPKVAVLMEAHRPFVQAIDLVFPGDELSDLQDYMVSILPLTDSGAFPDLVAKTSDVLRLAEQDEELTRAIARLSEHMGYRPRAVALGAVRELVSYPNIREVLNALLAVVGERGKGEQAFRDLMAGLSLELRTLRRVDDPASGTRYHPGAKDRPLRVLLDLLFTQNAAFGTGRPRWIVRRDHRGVAQVRSDPAAPAVPPPFVDADKDGLADLDVHGQLSVASGVPPQPFQHDLRQADSAPGRDAQGRAVDPGGKPLFEYLDLDTTLIGALARDAVSIMDPDKDIPVRLLMALATVLGERRDVQKKGEDSEMLAYRGFATDSSPLLDLAHAGLQVLRASSMDDTLQLGRALLSTYEGPTARLVREFRKAMEIASKHPEAKLEPGSMVFDELLLLLRKILDTPGLMQDILRALGDPRVRPVGAMLANYMKYRDVQILNPSTQAVANPVFRDLVDRKQPDSSTNRSIMQRLFHIMHDSNGMQMCNKDGAVVKLAVLGVDLAGPFKACDLFEVKNGALFYTQSIARQRDGNGNLTNTSKASFHLKLDKMPSLLRSVINTVGEDRVLGIMTGVQGWGVHPTPGGVNRMMFLDPPPLAVSDTQDPAVCIDGHRLNREHQGSLLAWEVPHPGFSCSATEPCMFLDAFRPLVQAFADHGAEQLLVDSLALLHRHWATKESKDHQFTAPTQRNFSFGSAFVRYEPLFVQILEQTDLWPALVGFVPILNGLTVSGGRSGTAVLVNLLADLTDPRRLPGLKYRGGQAVAYMSDGKTPVPGGVSAIYLLADALSAADRAFTRAEQRGDLTIREAWRESTKNLLDVFLAVEEQSGTYRFRNRRIVPAATVLLDFLRGRLKVHGKTGDLHQWLGQSLPADLERWLSSPVVAAAADLMGIVHRDARARGAIYGLLRYLVDEINSTQSFNASLTALADLFQFALDDADLVPVARWLGRAAQPEAGLIPAALRFLRPAVELDRKGVFTQLLRNAYKEQAPGQSPVQTLLDLCAEMHRKQPGRGTSYSGEDFAEAFRAAREFVGSQETGLAKFFDLVKNRCGGPCTEE